MHSSHTASLDLPSFSAETCTTTISPNCASDSLLSIGQLCDDSCTTAMFSATHNQTQRPHRFQQSSLTDHTTLVPRRAQPLCFPSPSHRRLATPPYHRLPTQLCPPTTSYHTTPSPTVSPSSTTPCSLRPSPHGAQP
jgi:hypothetical protein